MKTDIYNIFKTHKVVCTDSRNCPQHAIFFALKGGNFDGNRYAKAALQNGCAYAVIDDPRYAENEHYIVVDDVLIALQQLAHRHRKEMKAIIIGITGTNGKTTTKELIHSVLKQKYHTHATQGNLNNHIGVPLTLLQLDATHEMAIVEMGANHPHEIAELTQIVEPDYGLITNVGKGHLEGFGTFDTLIETKAALYRHLAQKEKKIFINTGNPLLLQMATKSGYPTDDKKIAYQLCDTLTTQIAIGKEVKANPMLSINCQTDDSPSIHLHTQLIGAYNAENVLAAVAVGRHFGLSPEAITKGIADYTPTNNRSQLISTPHNHIIADAYNANPTSVKAAIENLDNIKHQDKAIILGDMLELGTYALQEHQHIVDILQQKGYTQVLLVGQNYANTQHPYPTFSKITDCIQHLQQKTWTNKWILIKGSRGIELEKTLDYL